MIRLRQRTMARPRANCFARDPQDESDQGFRLPEQSGCRFVDPRARRRRVSNRTGARGRRSCAGGHARGHSVVRRPALAPHGARRSYDARVKSCAARRRELRCGLQQHRCRGRDVARPSGEQYAGRAHRYERRSHLGAPARRRTEDPGSARIHAVGPVQVVGPESAARCRCESAVATDSAAKCSASWGSAGIWSRCREAQRNRIRHGCDRVRSACACTDRSERNRALGGAR